MLYLHRFRPTQTKTRKTKAESKLEFFGFGDKEDQEGEDGSDAAMAGKSNYKIKYFGFDDLSESDSDDESSQAKEKKAKKAAAALAALCSSVDSPHTSDSQDSQASSNTGGPTSKIKTELAMLWLRFVAQVFFLLLGDFSLPRLPIWFLPTDNFDYDESSPGGPEGQKGRSGKQGDKSKDVGFKKIFSGPKKVYEHARNLLMVCLLSVKSNFCPLLCTNSFGE